MRREDPPMPTDTSRTIMIENSPTKMLRLVAGGVVLVVVSLFLTIPDGIVTKLIGWFGIIFFGLCTIVTLWRLFTTRGAVVTISPDGIRDVRIAEDMIPWGAVKKISTWEYQHQKFMVLAVDPDVTARLRLVPIARWTRDANRALGADGLCITAGGLKIDYATLLQTSMDYADVARRTAPGTA
jgi:hypothetical protein